MDCVEDSMAEAQGEKVATQQAAPAPAAPEPAAPRRTLSAVAALLVGLAVGAGVGVVAGGTLLAAWRSGALESQKHDEALSDFVESSPALAHTIDALVVNPAGSDGLRFLMASMVVEVDRQGTLDQLQRRDAEVREALLRTLGSKTVPELANVANRDTLKAELRNALLSVLDRGDVRRIHLPQFVIQ